MSHALTLGKDDAAAVGRRTERATSARAWLARAAIFVVFGLLLYGLLYGAAEQLANRTSLRNRFFAVHMAPLAEYDFVILGASHAMPFDFEDMNARLEQMTGTHILNLSMTGSGVVPNRLLLDYFSAKHSTRSVVYILDSFIFHSPEWNERRLDDSQLYARAPFDPTLGRLLLADAGTRGSGVSYLSGFPKINNPNRFAPDISDDEATRFGRVYRPLAQFDQQRLSFLYPNGRDEATFASYFGQFEAMARRLRAEGVRLLIVKPPIPDRWHRLLPGEQEFDTTMARLAAQHAAAFYDLSGVSNDESFFYNADHLNRTGVLDFFARQLAPLLAAEASRS
jgi:hypothetical protein